MSELGEAMEEHAWYLLNALQNYIKQLDKTIEDAKLNLERTTDPRHNDVKQSLSNLLEYAEMRREEHKKVFEKLDPLYRARRW